MRHDRLINPPLQLAHLSILSIFCLGKPWSLTTVLFYLFIYLFLPNHKLKSAKFNSSLNSRPIQKCKMASSRWRILPQTVGFHLKLFNFKVKTYFVAISRQKPVVFGVVRHLQDITLLIRNGVLILVTAWVTIKGLFIPLLPIYSKVIFLKYIFKLRFIASRNCCK